MLYLSRRMLVGEQAQALIDSGNSYGDRKPSFLLTDSV
jgi:hypothetical protein